MLEGSSVYFPNLWEFEYESRIHVASLNKWMKLFKEMAINCHNIIGPKVFPCI